MRDLRKLAKGRECQIRIPGVCNGNNETVVLCHIHKPSISGGTGLKANDLLAAWGCSACHDVVDMRVVGDISDDDVLISFFEAIFRTQSKLIDEGII